ncbi:DMT family transporter [soil metagenome]
MNKGKDLSGTWRMVAAMALSGTIGLFVFFSGQTALTVVWWRCLIGGLALLAWLTLQGGWQRLDRRAFKWLLVGASALIVNWLCLFSAYRLSSISLATVVYHVQPFFLLILTALLQKEALDWRKVPWLGLALVGVALSTGLDWGGQTSNLALLGILLALSAALLYAVATLATRKLSGLPPAQIAGLQLLFGAVVLAPWLDFSAAGFDTKTWVSLLTLGLVHTGLMYNLMYAAFQRLAAKRIAALSFVYPLAAIVVDLQFFNLRLSAIQVLGMGLILLALLAQQRNWRFTIFARKTPTQDPTQ